MSDAESPPDAEATLDSDDVVTVETLNTEIADVIDDQVDLHHEYVVGDTSDVSDVNGNLHFDLVYEDASIHCVLFGFRRGPTTVEPEEEMQVAVKGDLSYYEERGSCSILVTDVVDMGESDYSRVYEENRELLTEDGLLDDERKQGLPALPGTVGLVTSADSDARTDAVTAIWDRYPDVDIKLHHASVQGNDALPELMSAITTLDEDASVDVLVVTRGGGADKTLRVFNETPLCRVIAKTETPIVVGVGHEDDRTLADEVADRRVMTPTHAGEIVPKRTELEERLAGLKTDLETAYTGAVERKLAAYATTLDNTYRQTVSERVQDLETALTRAAERHAETKILDLEKRLETAYQAVEQEKEHEAELEATVEQVRDEAQAQAQAEVAATRRRYRRVVIALGVALLLLLLYFAL